MAKNKSKTAKVITKAPQVPILKARFAGLIKLAGDAVPPTFTTLEIEGQTHYEFAGLKGVYFSAKLFV